MISGDPAFDGRDCDAPRRKRRRVRAGHTTLFKRGHVNRAGAVGGVKGGPDQFEPTSNLVRRIGIQSDELDAVFDKRRSRWIKHSPEHNLLVRSMQ
jgi:hypothetical protein